jgi:hypothetical protein
VRLPKRCIRDDCQKLFRGAGSLCPDHATTRARGYGAPWAKRSRRARQAWISEHGWLCPGWKRPHHVADDLVVDHDLGVLCRQCNSTKAATEDKARAGRGA